jgi:integration host factor subunit alpha
MTRIKEDLIHDIRTKNKIDRKVAKSLVESIVKHIKDTLAAGDRVMISGFGDFKVVHKKPRVGRNPKTKVEHIISERKVVVFNPSKILRKEMNQS